jgi:hypothetical protein
MRSNGPLALESAIRIFGKPGQDGYRALFTSDAIFDDRGLLAHSWHPADFEN